jgi:pimeloyl-ACP methyl ester carboxylesterase
VWLVMAAALLADSAQDFRVVVGRAESLHVVTAGHGDPVVLLPGLFGSAYGFRKAIPLLTGAGYRTIVVEPLGIGTSSRPERADYSLGAQTERVAAVLDSLRILDAIVVGHSIGGAIAFRLAFRHPEQVRALVSIESGPTEAAATPAFRHAMRFAHWIKIFGGIRLIRRLIRRSLISSSGDTTWISDSVVAGYTAGAAANLDATLKAFIRMAGAHERYTLEPHLQEIRCPVLLMLGGVRHDGDVGPDEVVLLRSRLPLLALDSLPGVGHYPQEERPESVLDAVGRARGMASISPRRSE